MFRLTKCSSPGWDMDFTNQDEAVTELRRHICDLCLDGSEYEGAAAVDVEFDGRTIECRDADTLLSTSCGLEYYLEEIE